MQLAQNESVVKKWTYAQATQGSDHLKASITLTNRRFISSVTGRKECSQTEIPLENIRGTNVYFSRNSSVLAILLIILGALAALALVGIVFIILGISMLRTGEFILEVETEGTPVTFCSVAVGHKIPTYVKNVKLDLKTAKEISETIGTLLLVYPRNHTAIKEG